MDKYKAFKSNEENLWGIEDQNGAILYEPLFETQKAAEFLAYRHTQNPELTWDNIQPEFEEYERNFCQPPAPADADSATPEPPKPRYNHPAAEAISELSMNMTVLVTENWQRFQYTGEGREVIADRMDNQITHHLDILDDELAKARADLAAAQAQLADYRAFYKAMIDADSQNEHRDFLKGEMFAAQQKAGDTGNLPLPEIAAWAEFDALLDRLEEYK